MATRILSPTEKRELNIAFQRQQAGQGTPTDIRNLEYAKRTLGFTPTGTQPTPLAPLPMQAGEREAMINRYLDTTNMPQEQATARVDELFAGRPSAPAGAVAPPSLTFAPTGQQVSTRELGIAGTGGTPQQQAPAVDIGSSYQKAMIDLLRQYQSGGQGVDKDLETQRNELRKKVFETYTTPEEGVARFQSPAQRNKLEELREGGYEARLAGVDAAFKARKAERSELRQVMEKAQDRLADLEKEERGYAFEREKLASQQTLEREKLAQKEEAPRTGIVGEYEYYAQQEREAGRKPLGFNEYQTVDANRKRSIQNTYIQGGLTKDQFNRLNIIADNARQDPNIKEFPAIRAAYETARSAASSNNSAGDIILMRMLAKITDPTTGVREEEYRTFQSAIGTLPRYGVQATKQLYGKGQLTTAGRSRLLQEVKNIYQQRTVAYNNSTTFFGSQATRAGGSIEDVMPTYLAPEAQGQAETKVVNGKTYKKVSGGWKLQ